ncbi:metal ABC transporter solute-binding protein, Zn/Mn family [Planococcus citreus]|uniref:Zinc transport system substrate-binding protein n=1 Tax=Planococcus citreus TaxID=1373 RepID=A0A497YQX0_9BACL|nr:zinc ABC transporter substrate-binding protein [Planococcus citreus]RLJ90743.1 zinc transport system substrate-binding protein [Planococcus citreus]
MKKIAFLLLVVLLLAACSQPENASEEPTDASSEETADTTDASASAELDVFTTAYPLAYFTERIGGERVNVQSIYPPGSNEHTFEPTQQDMVKLAEADLLFYIGLGLEGFIDSAENTLSGEDVKLIATSNAISDEELESGQLHEEEAEDAHSEEETQDEHADEEGHEEESGAEDSHDEHGHGSIDPHVWISPVLSQKLAESIKDSLVEADTEGAEMYEENYEELVSELQQLDESYQALASSTENKTFFVSHDAFGYIADTYGFEQVPVAGLNSQDEPSQKELTAIVDLAKEKNIEHIAFEQNVSSKLAEVIQNEVGAEAVELHNLSVLTPENEDNDETYFTLMEKNLKTLETMLK